VVSGTAVGEGDVGRSDASGGPAGGGWGLGGPREEGGAEPGVGLGWVGRAESSAESTSESSTDPFLPASVSPEREADLKRKLARWIAIEKGEEAGAVGEGKASGGPVGGSGGPREVDGVETGIGLGSGLGWVSEMQEM
jgi:hypothetical protein